MEAGASSSRLMASAVRKQMSVSVQLSFSFSSQNPSPCSSAAHSQECIVLVTVVLMGTTPWPRQLFKRKDLIEGYITVSQAYSVIITAGNMNIDMHGDGEVAVSFILIHNQRHRETENVRGLWNLKAPLPVTHFINKATSANPSNPFNHSSSWWLNNPKRLIRVILTQPITNVPPD